MDFIETGVKRLNLVFKTMETKNFIDKNPLKKDVKLKRINKLSLTIDGNWFQH